MRSKLIFFFFQIILCVYIDPSAGTYRGQKRETDLLELKVPGMGAGNRIWAFVTAVLALN